MKMKNLLTLSVVGLMAFGAASCGGEDTKASGLNDAADYIWQLYKNQSSDSKTLSMKSYDVVTKVVIDEVEYKVDWSIATDGGIKDAVTLGESKNGKQEVNVVYDPVKSTAETPYTLTATITDAKGSSVVKSFERIVPEFKFSSFKDVAKAKKGQVYNVKGVITATTGYDTGYKNVDKTYIQNDEFGMLGFRMKPESKEVADRDLVPGNEIIISGTVTRYNGQIEFEAGASYTVTGKKGTVTPVDATAGFAKAADAKDKANLDMYQNSLVTLKGVTLGTIDAENSYYHFSIGGVETYLRTTKKLGLSDADNEALVSEWVQGYKADITALCVVYSNQYYLEPISKDAVKITERTLTDEVKVQNALVDIEGSFPANVVATRDITLPANAVAEDYKDVKYTYSVVEGASNFVLDGNTLKVTVGDTAVLGKVKVVASVNGKTAEKVFTLNAALPETTKIGTFVSDKENKDVQFLRGVVVAAAGDHNYAGSFIIADETGSVFSYEKFKVEVGDEVIISTTRDEFGAVVQSKTKALEGILSSGNSVDAYLANANVFTAAELKTKLAGLETNEAMFEALQGKAITVTGVVKKAGKGMALFVDAADTEYVVSLYANKALSKQLVEGETVTITGFLRGVKADKGNITVQVTTVTK